MMFTSLYAAKRCCAIVFDWSVDDVCIVTGEHLGTGEIMVYGVALTDENTIRPIFEYDTAVALGVVVQPAQWEPDTF